MTFIVEVLKTPRTWCKLPIFITITTIFTLFYILQETYLNLDDNFPLFCKREPFNGEKIVHLDLKGAPPKVSYLLKFIPLIQKLGATGILLEYEDMFPYQNDLEDIRALNAYTMSDIAAIARTAESNNLTIIPFIQTFGHTEFILKLEKYQSLREVENNPEAVCPSHENVSNVLESMIDQVLAAHPSTKYLHLGCGDVELIGKCPRCKSRMEENKWNVNDLFFDHVKKVAGYVVKNYPKVRPIIWGDKVTKKDETNNITNGISELLDVMFWNYKPTPDSFPSAEDISGYATLFKNMWIASAFKGTTGVGQILTNPEYYLNNNKGWMRIVSTWRGKINFEGIVLTGWQRANHFSALCELLPVAIPSLALSLQYLNKVEDYDYKELQHALQCNGTIPVTSDITRDIQSLSNLNCDFPGFNVYNLVNTFFNRLLEYRRSLNRLRSGAFSFYNVVYNFSNPAYMNELNKKNEFEKHLFELTAMENELRSALLDLYDEYTVNEWVVANIMPIKMRLEATCQILNSSINRKTWPRRPLQNGAVLLKNYVNQVCGPEETKGCGFFNLP